MGGLKFNPAPGWPQPPEGWVPPPDWKPDPSWPPAPDGWLFWKPVPRTDEVVGHEQPPRKSDATVPRRSAQDPAILPGRGRREGSEDVKREDIHREGRVGHVADQAQLDETGTARRGRPERVERGEDLRHEIALLREELIELNDAVLLQRVGIYEYHHPAENSEQLRSSLKELQEETRNAIRSRRAILASDRFAYNNSLAQGRKMTQDFSRLMLRAYNAEADNCVRSVRAGSVETSKRRLDRSAETIAQLGRMMEMKVAPDYHGLRLREIELTGDYMMMKQEERERAREERERIREEKRAELELRAERERLEKECEHYKNSLSALREQGREDEAAALVERIESLEAAIATNDYRIANIRAGYVYVISNIGVFGRDVVKIGLTRRLDPLDRVRELGGASVPFPFDVHAIYFAEDAVGLEGELHKHFAAKRVNHVNLRREFFFVTPEEVREVLTQKVGNLLDFQDLPEAGQFYQSIRYWPEDVAIGGTSVEVAAVPSIVEAE